MSILYASDYVIVNSLSESKGSFQAMDHAQRSPNVQSTSVRESCSIQSHMSTANSQQRLRMTPAGSTMVSEKRDRLDEVQPVGTVAADPINKILLKMGLLTMPVLPGAH